MPINPISFSEAIINARPILQHETSSSSWFGKKVYLGYSDSEGWKVQELGLFNRILRKLNLAYRNTHFQPINKKLEDLTKDDILPVLNDDVLKTMPRISARLQEICNQKIKNLGAHLTSRPAELHTQPFKPNFRVQVDTPLQNKTPSIPSTEEEKAKPTPAQAVPLANQNIPIGKVNALKKYMQDPTKCGKIQKAMIFNDIKHIELPHSKGNIASVVGLMQYVSGLEEVDLHHPLCEQVVIDVLKECNKETSEQLCQWLVQQKTFHPHLLKECLNVFIHKQEQQHPFSPFAVELLIKTYENKNWNQMVNNAGNPSLPSNDQSIISAMAILIKGLPNEDRIISLTEWMLNQPDYDLNTFSTWIKIFKEKEQENTAVNIYYPLLDKMIAHFKQKWGTKSLAELDAFTANYMNAKINPSAQPPKPTVKVQAEKPKQDKPVFIPKAQEDAKLKPAGAASHSPTIPIGKVKALEQYRKDPVHCGKNQKGMIFNDIKYIEPHYKKDLTSVVGLMQDVSGLEEVDLNHPLCARVIIDVFKECNKETSEQLSQWLVKQATFNPHLLKECLDVFIYKQQQQIAFSSFSIEVLITAYENKGWNQMVDNAGKRPLLSNDQSIVSSMAILIKNLPNDDKIISLAEWMLNQPDYDLNTFSTWIKIFKQKQQESTAINLYYPLLNKMVAHFKQKWGAQAIAKLDADTANYLNTKLQPHVQG